MYFLPFYSNILIVYFLQGDFELIVTGSLWLLSWSTATGCFEKALLLASGGRDVRLSAVRSATVWDSQLEVALGRMLARSTLFLCPITLSPKAHQGSAQDQFSLLLLHTFQQLATLSSTGNNIEVREGEPILLCV